VQLDLDHMNGAGRRCSLQREGSVHAVLRHDLAVSSEDRNDKNLPMFPRRMRATMKEGITKSILFIALVLILIVVAGNATGFAQSCPTTPNYLPDFTSNQNCLYLDGMYADSQITTYPGFYGAVQPAPSGVTNVLRLTPNQGFYAGSAWYGTQQPVAGAFTSTFTFQLTGANGILCGEVPCPGDGIAFLIQNSAAGTAALGPEACGIGFGGSAYCQTIYGPQSGISNSLAIEFNTFDNYDVDPSSSDVTIQNCGGTGANSVDPTCQLAVNDLTQLNPPINLSDGTVHTVTINYSGPNTMLLDVILDNIDLFPPTSSNPTGGVKFNMASIGLASGNSCSNCLAWVGFTAATGGADDNQDIQTWTFTPQAQTAVLSQNQQANLNFPNASGQNVYSYTGQLTAPYATPVIQVQPILMTQQACNQLVDVNFWPAQCFVYENAENTGVNASVLFAVTCPTSPGGTCGTGSDESFFAELGSIFEYSQSLNPFFVYPGIFGIFNPFPGWLKGSGPNALMPCALPQSGPLFKSNQIDTFFIDNGTTKGKSSGTGSCWVATYDTPGEIWPGITISSPKSTTYSLNQAVAASYTCSNPFTSQPASSPVGPYLTAASCTQSIGTQNSCTFTPPPGGGLSCTGTVPTNSKGLHIFTVTAIDSGGNQNLDAVIYNVK
jgi:Legume lectin domain